ncbi:MAG: trigger factor [Firmicutes bacterium]|nr:trigger factor [Bacillota bacterium]
MKKLLTMLLVLTLCFGLFTMTGCSKEEDADNPYKSLNLTEYVTLPDYNTYTTGDPNVEIKDKDVDEEIDKRLEAAATTETVTKGKVEEGDTVKISFKGTLADGTTEEGMNSDEYTLTLGQANMIDGFQEGLFGATIGKPVTLDLQFPDPYENNPDLAGKDVTFVVTVLSKEQKVIPKLTEEFIKENSDATTEEEYRKLVREDLEKNEYDSQLYDFKNDIYTKIIEETEVLKYPEGEVEKQMEETNAQYKAMADNYGYEDWDKFLSEYFQIDQAEYDEQIKLYAEAIVKQEMVIYAIAEKEKISISDEEFEEYLNDMLKASGFEDAEKFESYAGMTIDEYAKTYKLDRDLLLQRELDTIYDRLEKTAE